jgi:hypothetical protein
VGVHADVVDELAQRALDVPRVVADHRDGQDRAPVLVERADLGDRHVVGVGDPVLEALHRPPLVLQRHGVRDRQLELEDADGHALVGSRQ